jgi:opacity protein-like surface antigen
MKKTNKSTLNLTLVGNLIATVFVGVSVWLSSEWQPNPHEDKKQLLALALTYGAGLLTALSSQWVVRIETEPDSKIDGDNNHD